MNSKKQGLPGAMSYSASAAFSQDKSLIGAVEREGSCRWQVALKALRFEHAALVKF